MASSLPTTSRSSSKCKRGPLRRVGLRSRVCSYFERVNVHCDVLDPVLHTPASTFARCPFLFTVGAFSYASAGGSSLT